MVLLFVVRLFLGLRFVLGWLLRLRTILTLGLWTLGVRAIGVLLALLGSGLLLLLLLSRRAFTLLVLLLLLLLLLLVVLLALLNFGLLPLLLLTPLLLALLFATRRSVLARAIRGGSLIGWRRLGGMRGLDLWLIRARRALRAGPGLRRPVLPRALCIALVAVPLIPGPFGRLRSVPVRIGSCVRIWNVVRLGAVYGFTA